jgi:formylglycine-generating enzyme required for sulfatase activity
MIKRMASAGQVADPSNSVPHPHTPIGCRGASPGDQERGGAFRLPEQGRVVLVQLIGTTVLLALVAVVLPALAQGPDSGIPERIETDRTGQFMIAKQDKGLIRSSGPEKANRKTDIVLPGKGTAAQGREEIEHDLALYEKIAGAPSSRDLVPSTWKGLTAKYAASGEGIANLEVGHVRMLRMLLLEPLEFVPIKGGCFDMGDIFGDGSGDERPVHRVCVDDYAVGKFEVTQAQWEAVMGSNPSTFPQCGSNCPVESVSWNAVQEFITNLNALTNGNYRLPTEAEWEYAARSGGRREKFSGTSKEAELADYAWFVGNSDSQPHPVGQKKPNGLGIYDMSGNVWEWVEDVYSDAAYRSHSQDNPVLMEGGSNRVNRGGSWSFEARSLRTYLRSYVYPGIANYYVGFRLVRTNATATGRAAQRERHAQTMGIMNRSGTRTLGSLRLP